MSNNNIYTYLPVIYIMGGPFLRVPFAKTSRETVVDGFDIYM